MPPKGKGCGNICGQSRQPDLGYQECKPLGEWSNDSLSDPKSTNIPSGMLSMTEYVVLPKPKRIKALVEIIEHNRYLEKLPTKVAGVIIKHTETCAITATNESD